MSRRPILLAAAAVLGFAATASADGAPTAAATAPPSYTDLPTGTMSAPPSKKTPWGIGGGERVPGFVVQAQPGQPNYSILSSSKARATFSQNGPASTCFADIAPGPRAFGIDEADDEKEWGQAQPFFPISWGDGNRSVQAVHSERVAPGDDSHATLEWTDAWVDGSTHGARLIAKGSLPLKLVTKIAGGPVIWAGRDKDHVHVVVTEDPTRQISFGMDQLLAVTPRGSRSAPGCRHVRVGLRTDKASAETASVFTSVVLPSSPEDGGRNGKTDKEVRVRPVHIHASVSSTSKDKDPVVAISYGWNGRERSTPFVPLQGVGGAEAGF